MKMTAKERFEQNGYDLVGNVGGLTYRNKDGLGNQHTIRFVYDYKLVKMFWETINPANDTVLPYKTQINVNIHLAITQQMKELGWI